MSSNGKEKGALPINAPSSNDGAVYPTPTGNYTMTAEEARQAWESYLSYLPGDLAADYRRFDQRKIIDHLSKNGQAVPGLEALLPRLKVVNWAELLNKVFPPIPFVVPDYLPPGLAILSGRPKVGKSWLALQLAYAVMCGGKILGKYVSRGKVLYLALEDSERRLNDRMKKQGWSGLLSQGSHPGGVDFMLFDTFSDQIGSLNSGGGKRLLSYITNGKYRLVIVDTFSRAIEGDQMDANVMTEAIGPLQQQALNLNVALLLIDHMRKSATGEFDPILDTFGSVAKAGVLDTSWGIYKEQGKKGAKLAITGRDVNEIALKLVFDTERFNWHYEGEAYEVEITERRKEILEALGELGEANLTEIKEAIGGSDLSNILKRLNDLCNSGLVRRCGKLYRIV